MSAKRHRPVVTDFKVRPITFPDGHWMNRIWGPLAFAMMSMVARFPLLYRHILRMHPAAEKRLLEGGPLIFACVHQDIPDVYNGLPRLFQERPLAAIVSYSRDGSLAAMALRLLGYKVVRGSSSRGGGEGLLMLRTTLLSGTSVVMACDGPKAPLGDVKPGVVRLAATTGVPVLPVRAWGLNRFIFRRAWSKTVVTVPFCPVVFCVGAPIEVPPEDRGLREYQIRIARSIADLAVWASRWAGGPAHPPFTVAER